MTRMKKLHISLWPEEDRLAWEAANTASDDPWEHNGSALKLRPTTRVGYPRAYGI